MINSFFYDDDTPTMLHATVSPARNGRTTPVPNLYTDGTFHDFFSNVIVVVAFLSKPYNRRHDDIKILPTYPMHSRSNASAYNSTAACAVYTPAQPHILSLFMWHAARNRSQRRISTNQTMCFAF